MKKCLAWTTIDGIQTARLTVLRPHVHIAASVIYKGRSLVIYIHFGYFITFLLLAFPYVWFTIGPVAYAGSANGVKGNFTKTLTAREKNQIKKRLLYLGVGSTQLQYS